MKGINKFSRRLAVVAIVFLAAEFAVGVVFFTIAKSVVERALTTRAATIAASIASSEILSLRGDSSDLGKPQYLELKAKLARIKEANSDLRFAYIMGKKDGEYYFVVDNEPPDSEGYSPPGQVYVEASPNFDIAMESGKAVIDGPYGDRWGNWISGMAPILDPATGKSIALVGIDTDTASYYISVIAYTLLPVLVVGVLMLLVVITYMRHIQDVELLRLKSRFVSIVTHDLLSPLRGIKWASESLLASGVLPFDDEKKETIGLMGKTAENLSKLASDFLRFSRLEERKEMLVRLETAPLIAIVEEVAQTLSLASRERGVIISIDEGFPRDAQSVLDAAKTREAISNIVSNSIKFSKQNGRIDITYSLNEGAHVVAITNYGDPILPVDQEKIFKPDYSSDASRNVGGHGLGLYFSKEIMNAQGGKMWFESEPSHTTFFVQMPNERSI